MIFFFFLYFQLVKGHEAEKTQGRDSSMWLQVYMGLAWTLGCAVVGLLIVREPSECKIGRQYLCQVSKSIIRRLFLLLTIKHKICRHLTV